jgi:hypothetical protein
VKPGELFQVIPPQIGYDIRRVKGDFIAEGRFWNGVAVGNEFKKKYNR